MLNIDFWAAALLGVSAVLAIITSPRALKWLSLPIIMFFTMFIIDYFGYPDGIVTLKQYILWLLAFITYPMLHEDPHTVMANPNDLAYWCIFAVMASIAEVIRKKGFVLIAYMAIAIVSSMVLLLTVSRGVLMILVVCMLVFLLLNARRLGGVGAIFVLLATAGIALIIIYFSQPEAITNYEQRIDEESGNFSGRTYLLDELVVTYHRTIYFLLFFLLMPMVSNVILLSTFCVFHGKNISISA
jgi:hypothetical protein